MANPVLEKLMGPGKHRYFESEITGHVFAAGESMDVFTLRDPDGNAIASDRSNPLWMQMNKDRGRVSVEICYSSTLGECWTLQAGGLKPRHDNRDSSLPDSLGAYLPAVVK